MKDRILKILLPIGFVGILIFLWWYSAEKGLINKALFPYPWEIVKNVKNINHLYEHIFASIRALVISVGVGFFLGFFAGFAISYIRGFKRLEDAIAFFMAIPGISWAPLFIITIGFGMKTIIAVGVLTAFFPVVYNVYHGLKEVPKNYKYLGSLLEYTKTQKIFKIHLPAIMNYILIALKLALARTWRTIIAVEMVAASTFGLGYMIFDSREMLNMKNMFSGILLSGIIYLLIEGLFTVTIERMTVRKWGMKV